MQCLLVDFVLLESAGRVSEARKAAKMEDEAPPPYSETDIYSQSGIHSPAAARHQLSQSPADDSVSSSNGDVIYTPPLTPRSSHLSNFAGADHADHLTSASASASAYFESRPVPLIVAADDAAAVAPRPHTVTVGPRTGPDDIPYPSQLASRDVTLTDWQTFLNYLLPHHAAVSNEHVIDRKLRAEAEAAGAPVGGGVPGDESRSEKSGRSHAEAQLHQIRQSAGQDGFDAERGHQQWEALEATVREWNDGFFLPRGIRIQLDTTAFTEAAAAADAARMPGAWDQSFDRTNSNDNNNNSRNNNDAGRAGARCGGWRPSALPRFNPFTGENLPGPLRTPSGGFRFAGLNIEGDRVTLGNSIELGPEGVRIGSFTADHTGIRVGGTPLVPGPGFGTDPTLHFRGGGCGANRGRRERRDGPPPHHGHPGAGEGRRSRSHSRSSTTTSSSSSSVSSSDSSDSASSIGSLPDWDDLRDTQLPVTRAYLTEWLAHPEQYMNKESVKLLRQTIKEAKRDAKAEEKAAKDAAKAEEKAAKDAAKAEAKAAKDAAKQALKDAKGAAKQSGSSVSPPPYQPASQATPTPTPTPSVTTTRDPTLPPLAHTPSGGSGGPVSLSKADARAMREEVRNLLAQWKAAKREFKRAHREAKRERRQRRRAERQERRANRREMRRARREMRRAEKEAQRARELSEAEVRKAREHAEAEARRACEHAQAEMRRAQQAGGSGTPGSGNPTQFPWGAGGASDNKNGAAGPSSGPCGPCGPGAAGPARLGQWAAWAAQKAAMHQINHGHGLGGLGRAGFGYGRGCGFGAPGWRGGRHDFGGFGPGPCRGGFGGGFGRGIGHRGFGMPPGAWPGDNDHHQSRDGLDDSSNGHSHGVVELTDNETPWQPQEAQQATPRVQSSKEMYALVEAAEEEVRECEARILAHQEQMVALQERLARESAAEAERGGTRREDETSMAAAENGAAQVAEAAEEMERLELEYESLRARVNLLRVEADEEFARELADEEAHGR